MALQECCVHAKGNSDIYCPVCGQMLIPFTSQQLVMNFKQSRVR